MLNQLSADIYANWVSMMRPQVEGAIILTEDGHQAKFWNILKNEKSTIICTKNIINEVFPVIKKRGVHGVIAITKNKDPKDLEDGIFQSSWRDEETLLLMSSNFLNSCSTMFGDSWKIAWCSEIVDVISHIAMLSWIITNIATNIPFCNLDELVDNVVEWANFTLSVNKVLQLKELNKEYVAELLKKTRAIGKEELLKYSDGMISLKILASASKLYFPKGIRPEKSLNDEDIFIGLCLGFIQNELENDHIYWRLKAWERNNIDYVVLKEWRLLDSLGVLLDQRYWENDLSVFHKKAEADAKMALIKLDLDNFKQVNDILGHNSGDEALIAYCSIVKDVIGKYGDVYRRGGDEVIAFIPKIELINVLSLAEELRGEIEEKMGIWASDRKLPNGITASIGITVFTKDKEIRDIVDNINLAQKKAKQEGKNRVCELS